MATIFRSPKQRKNPKTGKMENAVDDRGRPLFHPRWRTVIVDHKGRRRTYTFGTNKPLAQKQADMLETREREIRNGVRPAPTVEDKNASRAFADVCREYFIWGRARGGKRNMPWDEEYAAKKERNLAFWSSCLGLESLGDLYGILPKVEAECHRMLESGKTGKTVSNKVLDLTAVIRWCNRRKYLTGNPLAELGKFDTSPQTIRRAMTEDELHALLTHCASHRRLLYEVACCTGLREKELRRLKPEMLDREACAIRVPKRIDKGRKFRLQYIPAKLMVRLEASVKAGDAREIYAKTYQRQGERENGKKPPGNPLLYVPANSATMLKRDLESAGIPVATEKGKLDFHALRAAFINFVLDVSPDVKTAQELARHETADMTLNVYGRAKEERCRAVVEMVGRVVLQDDSGQGEAGGGREDYTK
ncbi:MAG: tyrosine-type recombinase/integrase [Planctomycetota bacterium]|jgi:integrase|nr:tyrosine-type recombinase/integrase [Planctomycetota bacterium]